MTEKTKPCPACNKQIDKSSKVCPECKKILRVLYWELEQASGKKTTYPESVAEAEIRERLISGDLTLSDRCRQYTDVLLGVTDGKDDYQSRNIEDWKTLKDFAGSCFSLQVLYDPVPAYGKRVAFITAITVGIIVAIGWNTSALLAVDANPIVAVILSALLLALTPTIIGLAIASFITGAIYDIPAMGMVWRTVFAIVIGGISGAVIGWTLGYLIGCIIGLTKKKVLTG